MSIEIPPIVSRELWERNQARIDRNKQLSTRNSKGVYLLQGLIFCGDCGKTMVVRQHRYYYYNGERRERKTIRHGYFCSFANRCLDDTHPKPYSRSGPPLDWLVWRRIVDYGIKQPELIREEVLARQAELQAQGDSVDGDIAHARRKVAEVDSERAFYQRQAARGKMTEAEFDTRMGETEEARRYWQSELVRFQELGDNTAKIETGLDYVTELLTTLQAKLPEIDRTPAELKDLPEEERNAILKARRGVVRALVDKVEVSASGEVKIHGLVDGSEAAQFELGNRWIILWCARSSPARSC